MPKTISGLAWPPMMGTKGRCFILGLLEKGQSVEKGLRLSAHFYCLVATRHHVAAQYNLAVMMASGKGVKHDPGKALTLILIAKRNTGLKPNARLRLNQFQTAIKGMLNNAQISSTKWQVEKLFGTRI